MTNTLDQEILGSTGESTEELEGNSDPLADIIYE